MILISKRSLRIFSFIAIAASLTWLAVNEGLQTYRSARVAEAAKNTLELVNLTSGMAPSAVADAVRQFINANSVHKIDAEFYAHWGDNERIFRRLAAHYRGEDTPPHLECSSRAGLVAIMLRQLGFLARSIVVYDPGENFPSHTFLEFFNGKTGRWEAQDPDYNVYWIKHSTGQRIGIHEIIASDLNKIVPCIGDTCKWNIESVEGLHIKKIKTYLGLSSIRDYANGNRPLLVNQKRIPKNRLEAFCKKVKKDCRQKIIKHPDPNARIVTLSALTSIHRGKRVTPHP